MNLRSVDLNLLVVLDALLIEKHVTRAAMRVGLSQPAMSNALRRLRQMLGDELLVRTAAGMEATPRALEVAEPVRHILRQAERLLESGSFFDPAQSRICLRLRMSDVLEHLLLPGLLKALEREAPGVSLDIVHLPPDRTISALERDELDVAVSMDLNPPSSICESELLRDRMVCVMAKHHPLAEQELTLDKFLTAKHLKVSMSPIDGRYIDAALTRMGKSRDVMVNLPHWLVVPDVLRHSSMIAVISEHLAKRSEGGLVLKKPPFDNMAFSWSLYWHRRYDSSPAHRWLRAKLAAAAFDVAGGEFPCDEEPE